MSSKLLQQTNDGILQQTGAGNFILLNGAAETWHLTQENEWGIILESGNGYLVTQNQYNLTFTIGYYSLTGYSSILLWMRQLVMTTGHYIYTGFGITVAGITDWTLKVVSSVAWILKDI